MRAGLVGWLIALHAAAVLLFTRGFLLTRLSPTELSQPIQDGPASTHKRAVVLIIDALRFDFLSPQLPHPPDPYYHNVLTFPSELTKAHPEHSFLFNAYADPPTTTQQRIQALSTGSLPTFIDMGNNFEGAAVLGDSIIKQLQEANKTIAYMGDAIWLSAFPNSFHQNLTFPYDAFRIEDIHTADTGVLTHLFPLLRNQHPGLPNSKKKFDFLLGHFSGVDHVGHHVGPAHPFMYTKLKQMDTVLRQVVSLLDDDTLLVVLGDHGMNHVGNHGGDSVLETSTALWIYSKGRALLQSELGAVPSGLIEYKTFPRTPTPWRSVQQIDWLPTISLLLGLPIPYSNLGTVIPELFWRRANGPGDTQTELSKALQVNSAQIHQYLQTYRSSSSGSELDTIWTALQSSWHAVSVMPKLPSQGSREAKLISLMKYNRIVLSACRATWAQFHPALIAAGLAVMISTILISWLLYFSLSLSPPSQDVLALVIPRVWRTTLIGSSTTFTAYQGLCILIPKISYLGFEARIELAIFVGAMLSCATCFTTLVTSQPEVTFTNLRRKVLGEGGVFGVLILGVHTTSFFLSSFTFWEDRLVLWLCTTSVVPVVLCGIAAPRPRPSSTASISSLALERTKHKLNTRDLSTRLGRNNCGLRGRILGFTILFLISIRLMNLVTICREEQGGQCQVTFFKAPHTSPSPPPISEFGSNPTHSFAPPPMAVITTTTTIAPTWSLLLSLPTALLLPHLVTRILRTTKNDTSIAPFVVWRVFAPALVGAWLAWIIDWIDIESVGLDVAEGVVQAIESVVRLRTLRTLIAWCIVGWVAFGTISWWTTPVCLDIRVFSTASSLSTSSSSTRRRRKPRPTQVVIPGYANVYGASYMMFYLFMFALVYLCMPLPGQVVLGLSMLALLAYLEMLNGVRNVWELERAVRGSMTRPSSAVGVSSSSQAGIPGTGGKSDSEEEDAAMEEPTALMTTLPLILLSFITFYATGHQSTVSSIQWKTGFVLSEDLWYPGSIATIFGNGFGMFWLFGLGVGGLLGGWKRPPQIATPSIQIRKHTQQNRRQEGKEPAPTQIGVHISHSTLLTTLLIQLYFLTLVLGTSLSAAVLRRHLMVWKVFAPRFMTGAWQLLMVDLGILFGWGLPLPAVGNLGMIERVVERVGWVLQRAEVGKGEGKMRRKSMVPSST